jgi:hypothetical protein
MMETEENSIFLYISMFICPEAENMFRRMEGRTRSIVSAVFEAHRTFIQAIEDVVVHFVQVFPYMILASNGAYYFGCIYRESVYFCAGEANFLYAPANACLILSVRPCGKKVSVLTTPVFIVKRFLTALSE